MPLGLTATDTHCSPHLIHGVEDGQETRSRTRNCVSCGSPPPVTNHRADSNTVDPVAFDCVKGSANMPTSSSPRTSYTRHSNSDPSTPIPPQGQCSTTPDSTLQKDSGYDTDGPVAPDTPNAIHTFLPITRSVGMRPTAPPQPPPVNEAGFAREAGRRPGTPTAQRGPRLGNANNAKRPAFGRAFRIMSG